MSEVILFTISSLPVILIGLYIYKKDKEKEPLKLLIKLFISGILSCFLVLIISGILGIIFPIFAADETTLNYFQLIIYVVIGVALVEEFCKWLMTYTISYNDSAFETAYDMIIYSTFVSLGFAFFENLIYVYGSGITTGIIRAISAVPGHVCYGVFMGYYLGLAKQNSIAKNTKERNKNICLSIIVPTIMHGIYDYCLFTENNIFILIFIIFVIAVYIKTIKKIKKTSSIDKKIKNENNYCPNCGNKISGNFCSFCGRKKD